MKSRPSFADLIAFNVAVIAQAQALAEAYRARAGAFRAHVGPHLRHVIEHYESLLQRQPGALVDYDHRARDRELERVPERAVERLAGIVTLLQALLSRPANEPVSVGLSIGMHGQDFYLSPSTLSRELNFLASHAIHHYAIIKPVVSAAGITIPGEFGKAPDTIRHERLQWAS